MNQTRNVSVILPVRNEAQYIAAALDAVMAQDFPADQLEVLIADGMSTDGTRQVIQRYQQDHAHISLIDNLGQIVPTGMNLALAQARGDILIRVDGHCLIAPDYISRCVEHLQRDGVDGVGGPMQSIGETPLAETIALAVSSPFGVGNSAFRTTTGKTLLVDTVPFPAYTRQIVERAGPYDEELVRNQDDEYNYRIRGLGGKLLLAEDIHSRYFSRGSLKSLWRQFFQYGFYKVRVMQKHPAQMSTRQFIPPLFVLGLGVSALLALAASWGWFPLVLIGGGYLLANLAAATLTASRNGWRHFPLLPVIFAIIHLGYGSGFISGLVHFRNRWGDKTGRTIPFSLPNR